MSFIWPVMLALLLLIPLGVLAWLRLGRRRLARLGALGGLAAAPVPAARTGGVRVRRRITAGLFVLGSAVMVVALARPQAVVSVPKLEGTVILAFDVSGSMAADDIKPTRMEAAKAAARAFVGADQRPGDRRGRDQPSRANARNVRWPGDHQLAHRDRGGAGG